jgi:hypothetical protein
MTGLDAVVIPSDAYEQVCDCRMYLWLDRDSLHVDEGNGDAQVNLRCGCSNESVYQWTVSDDELRAVQGYEEPESTFSPELLALVPNWPDLFLDPPDDAPIEQLFEHGYCHALALALNEATDWSIVGLRSPGGVEHYLVQRPDGMLVDVRGVTSEEEMLGDSYTLDEGYDAESLWAAAQAGYLENPEDVWELARFVAQVLLDNMQASANVA